MTNWNLTALLPMKGNSERVKNKNMRDFCGKPLYHAVMKSLSASKYVDKVVINTDSAVIAEDAKENFGGRVVIVKRPVDIQGDFVSMNIIIGHDLSVTKGEHYIQTHSTNPLLKPETIDKATERYFSSLDEYDSIFSVTKVQTRFYDENASPVNHNPQKLIRTQDLEPLFEENSNFYIFSKDSFRNAGDNRIGIKPQIFEMNKLEAVDIDEPEDFIMAQILYQEYRMKKI